MNDQVPKEVTKRRPRGSGSVYQCGAVWWIAYRGPDGRRIQESSGSLRKGDAERMLRRRVGAREHGLPVIPNVEKTTWEDGVQAMLEDFKTTGKRSLDEVARRIKKHLAPEFGGRRLIGIRTACIRAYTAKRLADTIVVRKERKDAEGNIIQEEVRRPVSPAEINRELQTLKRILSLAVRDGRLPTRPHITMLREDNVRSGFFEAEQFRSVIAHLPSELAAVVRFAYLTGWRIDSEVLPLQWRQVDIDGGEVRLNAGTTKNGAGRVFPLTTELRTLLKEQLAEHERVKKAGHICPFVFFREVAEKRGGPKKPQQIVRFDKTWRAACVAAGCPGRIPHDLRRTAVRNHVRAGVPERVAMRLTGHKTASVFARYDIVSDGDLREAARKLDAVAGMSAPTDAASAAAKPA